ncbi:MAG: hypothetical protein FWB71_02920, partial [Defluviitaleaceae bacterium]|nr:hypothetical protein [Defluviitaleaceae bacterium]
ALRQIGMPNIFSPARAVLVFGLFTSAYQIFIGIMGIRDHANYAKAPLLYAFGVVDLALVIIGLIISGFVWTVIFSLPLPILFIIGAHKNLAFSGQTTNIQEVLQTALAAITKPTPPTVHMPYHPPAPAPEPAPEVNPAGCLHCGNIMNDDDLFCSGCGQKRAAL